VQHFLALLLLLRLAMPVQTTLPQTLRQPRKVLEKCHGAENIGNMPRSECAMCDARDDEMPRMCSF